MKRRISSALTEFYKVYVVFSILLFCALFGFEIFDSTPWFVWLTVVLNLIIALDSWRMKEVEMTDAGLIVSSRLFFRQKTIFVSYDKIETVKAKLWWMGNINRVSIKFTENTEFGKEISFFNRGMTLRSQSNIIEELKLTVRRYQTEYYLDKPFQQLDQ